MSADDVKFDQTQTPEDQAARIALSDMDGLAKMAHEMRGQPYGIPHLTPDQELWAWMHHDESIDHNALLAQGLTPSEVAAKKFPLQAHLMEQAGTSFDDQNAYAQRMTARAMKAYQAGRMPKPPARGPQSLNPQPAHLAQPQAAPPMAQPPGMGAPGPMPMGGAPDPAIMSPGG